MGTPAIVGGLMGDLAWGGTMLEALAARGEEGH